MFEPHRSGRAPAKVCEVVEGSGDPGKYNAMNYLTLGTSDLATDAPTMSEPALRFCDPSLPGPAQLGRVHAPFEALGHLRLLTRDTTVHRSADRLSATRAKTISNAIDFAADSGRDASHC